MHPLLLVTSADAGRIDQTSLNDQTRLELLIDGFTDVSKARFQDKDGSYRDIFEWPGIESTEVGKVTQIQWDTDALSGSVNFGYMPVSIKTFLSAGNDFHGQIALFDLPHAMEIFCCSHGKHSGTIDLSHLPPTMVSFDVGSNCLEGSLCLTSLPPALDELFLDANNFSGAVDFTALPQGLRILSLARNTLTGEIQLESLPKGLQYISVNRNKLFGSLNFTKLPDTLVKVDVSMNRFSGEISLSHLPKEIEIFNVHGNELMGKFVAMNMPKGLKQLIASSNKFSGEAVVHVPGRVRLFLGENDISSVVHASGKPHYMAKDFCAASWHEPEDDDAIWAAMD